MGKCSWDSVATLSTSCSFQRKEIQMRVELARFDHLDDIMVIERETFGEVGEGAMASRELMRSRIERCNVRGDGWFFVAVHEGQVIAYLVLQPTDVLPESCVSWDASTDFGTFEHTYNEEGETIFGVSLGAKRNAPPGAASFLIHKAHVVWIERKRKRIMLCSRIPSLSHAMEHSGVSAEEYCFRVDENGKPLDWLLREFHEVFGVLPARFLPNGYMPDQESGGHGALFVIEDPYAVLELTLLRVYESGIAQGKRSSRGNRKEKTK